MCESLETECVHCLNILTHIFVLGCCMQTYSAQGEGGGLECIAPCTPHCFNENFNMFLSHMNKMQKNTALGERADVGL